MTRDAQILSNYFDLLNTACWNVEENDRCGDCPLKHICLKTTPLIEVADLVGGYAIDEFLEFADTCLPSEELQNDMAMNADYDNYRDKECEYE